MTEPKKLELQMRSGEIDCNNTELFFSDLIKGLMSKLDDDISIRSEKIPHIILNTGDDLVYLSIKGHDQSKEPYEVTNEDYVYGVIPRCIVSPKGISFESDQTSNPYSNISLEICCLCNLVFTATGVSINNSFSYFPSI